MQGAVIEYIVHGYFYWRETDTNGTYGGGCRFGGWSTSWGRSMLRRSWQSLSRKMQRLKTDAIARAVAGDSSDDGAG